MAPLNPTRRAFLTTLASVPCAALLVVPDEPITGCAWYEHHWDAAQQRWMWLVEVYTPQMTRAGRRMTGWAAVAPLDTFHAAAQEVARTFRIGFLREGWRVPSTLEAALLSAAESAQRAILAQHHEALRRHGAKPHILRDTRVSREEFRQMVELS